MKPDAATLRRLSPLLDQALALQPDALGPWLASLSPADADLVPELRRLLTGQGTKEISELLQRGPAAQFGIDAQAPDRPSHAAGELIDQYRLLRQIAAGGMGEVWLAERADNSIKRNVAIKLPVVHLRASILSQRLQVERDILAGLNHANIARLYDAGMTGDDQPYLVLEYVPGLPITEYADAHALDLAQRIRLVRQVTDAVQHAHDKLIIHRDIKPSNVMVTPEGRAVLLDFGIAKVLADDLSDSLDSELTRTGGRALTLQYAAPEQIRNQPIGVAADVWALGVLLYRLVTGRLPFADADRGALEQAIVEADPPRPSEIAPQAFARLGRDRAFELDLIILHAMEKQVPDRYASVAALAHDLDRWLAGEPSSAGRFGHLKQFTRLVRNYRTASIAIALVVAVAVANLLPFDWRAMALGRRAGAGQGQELPREPLSVMVLPFVNGTGDPQQGYVADGLTVSLTSDLARIRDIFIVALNTALSYKDKTPGTREIRDVLGVRFLLSGNVQRSGGQLRVNVQLADTETGAQLWSDSIEGDVADVLGLQDRVTSRVGNTIAAEMILAAVNRPAAHGRESEVAELTLRARALDLKPDTIANLRAVEALYRQILKIEPGNSNAMGRLSRALALQAVNFSHELDALTIRGKTVESYEYATRALGLDPGNTDVYSAMANYWRYLGDFKASMKAGEAWIAAEPKNPRGYILLAYDKYFNVRPREVIELLNQAVKLHPKILSVSESSHRSLGRAHFMLGDDDAAIHWLQMALQINPKSSFAYQWLALAYARKGELEQARAAAAEVRRLNPDRKLSTEKGYDNTPAEFNRWFDQVVIPAWQLAGLPQ